MASYWGSVYLDICTILMEPPKLRLGLMTDADFYSMAGEVLTDFLSSTEMIKRVFFQPMLAGISTYAEPPLLGKLQGVYAAQTHLYQSSDYFLDNSDPSWPGDFAQPQEYHEDSLPIEQVQITPTPNLSGYQVNVLQGQGGYGIICGTSTPNDFDLIPDITSPAGYGVIAAEVGNPFLEVLNAGFGLISTATPSRNNVQMLGPAIPFDPTGLSARSLIELVPDSFIPYLKYGILARIFSSDSELKTTEKAAYCQARYQEGINLMNAVMVGEYEDS